MTGNPFRRRTEEIMKQNDEPNWRSQKWDKHIQEAESLLLAPQTEMSIKIDNDEEQNLRS